MEQKLRKCVPLLIDREKTLLNKRAIIIDLVVMAFQFNSLPIYVYKYGHYFMYLPFCDLPHVYTSPEELTTAVCCWPQDNLTGLHRNSTVLSGCEQQIREIQLILSTLLSLIKEIFTLILNEMGELSTQGKSTAQ